MKSRFFLMLFILLFMEAEAQKIYTDKAAYERAMLHYTHAQESYENYIRKINFYSRLKYPRSAVDAYGERFVEPVVDLMLREGIRLDNNTMRYHADVQPAGEMNFYYFEDPFDKYIKVVIMERDTTGYIYSSTTYSFRHPGKPPVYKPVKKKNGLQKINIPVTPVQQADKADLVQRHTPPKKTNRFSYYLMPNGDRYPNREMLTKAYPMFVDEQVFSFYFDKR